MVFSQKTSIYKIQCSAKSTRKRPISDMCRYQWLAPWAAFFRRSATWRQYFSNALKIELLHEVGMDVNSETRNLPTASRQHFAGTTDDGSFH